MSKFAGQPIFGRRYRIIADPLDISELHCKFKIVKSMSGTGNHSEIIIYNLSPNSENKIVKNGTRVIIEAGYQGPQYGLIFDGDAIETYRYKEDNVTKALELLCQDGDIFLNKTVVSVTYTAGQDPQSIIAGMAGKGDKNITLGNVSENLSKTKLARSKAVFGQPKDILRSLAKSEDGLFYINDRKINLVKPMDLPDGEVISLTHTSGLIGSPEETDDGVKARCLLNPLLNLNKMVHIDTSGMKQQLSGKQQSSQPKGNGIFKIISLEHIGDTHGNDWYTDIVGIAQPGLVPQTGKSFSK